MEAKTVKIKIMMQFRGSEVLLCQYIKPLELWIDEGTRQSILCSDCTTEYVLLYECSKNALRTL